MNQGKDMSSVTSNAPEMFLYNVLMLLLYLLLAISCLSDQTQTSFRDSENFPVIEQCPRLQFTAKGQGRECSCRVLWLLLQLMGSAGPE